MTVKALPVKQGKDDEWSSDVGLQTTATGLLGVEPRRSLYRRLNMTAWYFYEGMCVRTSLVASMEAVMLGVYPLFTYTFLN